VLSAVTIPRQRPTPDLCSPLDVVVRPIAGKLHSLSGISDLTPISRLLNYQ
jgi:hypothetical protein